MFPPDYDRYGRRRPGPREEPKQVLTASQIAKIESAFEELNRKAAHWEAQAKQWQATATQSRTQAEEWQARAQDLQSALDEARDLAEEARRNAGRWQQMAGEAQEKFDAWEARAVELETEATDAEQRVAELEEALHSAEQGHGEEAERLSRIEADFLDSKQRLERRFEIQAGEQRKRVFRDLLPVLDNLDRALEHLPAGTAGEQQFRQGVELTRQSFIKMLADNNVHAVETVGQPFDPEVHEAVGTTPSPTLPPGTIVSEEQKGYQIGDELLRPARVLVTPL